MEAAGIELDACDCCSRGSISGAAAWFLGWILFFCGVVLGVG